MRNWRVKGQNFIKPKLVFVLPDRVLQKKKSVSLCLERSVSEVIEKRVTDTGAVNEDKWEEDTYFALEG